MSEQSDGRVTSASHANRQCANALASPAYTERRRAGAGKCRAPANPRNAETDAPMQNIAALTETRSAYVELVMA
jgi:hypothetical protein